MNTQNIETVFVEYLKTNETQFAILLNGKWGSGKTYFWKNRLDKIAESNNFRTIYISLNGVNKIENLEYQLFLKLLPLIGKTENKLVKNAFSVVANIANSTTKSFFKIGIGEALKDVKMDSFNFSKHVICFDDLERCQIPIKEVLGFINNYVEHKFLKTIILADENNIEPNNSDRNSYNDIKEKVIGRIITYEPNLKMILPLLFKKYEIANINFYNFLQNHFDAIVGILLEYKQSNLRIIAFYIEVLEKAFPHLSKINEKYISEVVLFSALISIEFKTGKLKSSDSSNPKDIQNIDEQYYSLYIAKTQKSISEKEVAAQNLYTIQFYEQYLTNRLKQYYFYPSIYLYILTGYLDASNFQNELKERHPITLSEQVLSFRALLNYKFRGLSNSEFLELSTKVLNYTKEGAYSIYDYAQIANFFLFFSANKLVDKSKDEILKIINQGLNIARQRKEIDSRIIENLLHFRDENPEVEKVKLLIKEIHNEIKKEQVTDESKQFIDILLNKDEYALADAFQKHKFSKDLFQYIDNEKLFDATVNTSNNQIFNFTELLNDRYKPANIGEFIFEDYDCLKGLKEKLSTFVQNNKQEQPRLFLLETLISSLEANYKHLAATKKHASTNR